MADNTLNQGKKKLPIRMKGGYAVGQMSDSVGFNVFYFFFLYFLTDFAGIPAGMAGTISLIAVTWDAVTDPIVGHISDNLGSKYGRRRPMMIISLIPYSICTFLLFNNIDFSSVNIKFVYFVFIAILFWSCYKVFVIPFFALGAELTDDFNERTSLRSWASVLMYCAVMLASAAPPMIVALTESSGGTGTDGWRNVGMIFAAAIAITIFVCWICTKGGELATKSDYQAPEKEKGNFIGMFVKNIVSMLKIKPTKYLVLSVLFWAIVSSMSSGGLIYIMTNITGLVETQQSTVFVVMSLAGIAWLPLINFGAKKADKKKIYLSFMFVSAIGMIVFNFIGFPSMMFMILFVIMFQFGNSTFWTLYYSMMYDISELDEFVTGKRREGTIAALMSFSQKLGAAIALWLTGTILQHGGYDGMAAEQSESAINAIMMVNTWVPGIIGLGSVVFALAYPLTRPRFEALMAALTLKREGKAYTTDGFEKLL